MHHFGPKNHASSELSICYKDFFLILYIERGQEVHENYINVLSEKNSALLLLGDFYSPKMMHLHNSGSAPSFFFHNESVQEVLQNYVSGFSARFFRANVISQIWFN